MAMEKLYVLRDTHTRGITALGYHVYRREIFMGCEDGIVKRWDYDTRKLNSSFMNAHTGWVTDFLYWPEERIMFSSANDGILLAWTHGNDGPDSINLGEPIYALALNPKRQQLICGMNCSIKTYNLDPDKESSHVVNSEVVYATAQHTDIVRCLVCYDSRVYSAGYDQRLVAYDSSYTGEKCMPVIFASDNVHEAGITQLLLIKDNENNSWIVTGSFDKVVKIWSPDGKLIHKLEGFLSTITGLCYVPRNKTIWICGGTAYAYLYDPKSGDNVSDFIGTFQNMEESNYYLQKIHYFPEIQQVIGSTSRRQLMSWKYNPFGCITALACRSPLESITYTSKVPLLIFSGDGSGMVTKWERMQSNHFMYSKESFLLEDCKRVDEKKNRRNKKSAKKKMLLENTENTNLNNKTQSLDDHTENSFLRSIFVEELDLIVGACEDGNIYVWGFDEDAVNVLQEMKPNDDGDLIKDYACLLDEWSPLRMQLEMEKETVDSVTNRVAGFVGKYVLSEHLSSVTALTLISRDHGFNSTYLLSAGWDRRICLWNLETGLLHDRFRNSYTDTTLEHVELASDGVITDMAYCPTRNEFAYSSSDKMVYIRQFSLDGHRMVSLNTLQGHYGEVTCVHWNQIKEKWITGSDDGTIRIWSSVGLNDCEQILDTNGSVTSLCIDSLNGAIVAGIQNIINVYEPEQYRVVQTNIGHTDAIRSIIHVPERNQYLSASWDKTIRVWNAWKMIPNSRRKRSKNKERSTNAKDLVQQTNIMNNLTEIDENDSGND